MEIKLSVIDQRKVNYISLIGLLSVPISILLYATDVVHLAGKTWFFLCIILMFVMLIAALLLSKKTVIIQIDTSDHSYDYDGMKFNIDEISGYAIKSEGKGTGLTIKFKNRKKLQIKFWNSVSNLENFIIFRDQLYKDIETHNSMHGDDIINKTDDNNLIYKKILAVFYLLLSFALVVVNIVYFRSDVPQIIIPVILFVLASYRLYRVFVKKM